MGAESFWPTELADGEIEKAARILRTFTLQGAQADDDPQADQNGGVVAAGEAGEEVPPHTQHQTQQQNKDKYASKKTQKVIKKIPPRALQSAVGIAIFTCFRTGFGLSGASGSGVVLAKLPDGSWGPPSGLLIHTIGYGFLIGIDIYDVVLIIRNERALKAFEKPKISIGGEFSVAAGPVGNGATLNSGIESAPCWSYTKSKGVSYLIASPLLSQSSSLTYRRLCWSSARRHYHPQGEILF
jgi:lipid-binding SYLF domain-containing protein